MHGYVAQPDDWIVASGSLRRGVGDNYYAHICQFVHQAGARFAPRQERALPRPRPTRRTAREPALSWSVSVHSEVRPSIRLDLVQDRELRIEGALMYVGEDYRTAMSLIEAAAVDTEELITATFPLTEAAAAFAASADPEQVKGSDHGRRRRMKGGRLVSM